jgi:aryl-alcohol dehydrogenase-like predicted oxidoreductase
VTESRYRSLGSSGLQVSVVGLGTNNFGSRMDQDAATRVVHAALDAGMNLFDTADSYGGEGRSEVFLGKALQGRRDEAVIATKFASPMGRGPNERGASRGWITKALDASLRRLGTDHIDLYQQHRPDPRTPIEETLAALDDAVRAGKVRYLGSSNFSGWQIADADWTARSNGLSRFVSAQNEYSLLQRGVEREVIPACRRFGQGMLPFFPLASGLLTGKYRRGEAAPEGTRLAGGGGSFFSRFLDDANFDKVEALATFAAERGVSLLQVAMGALAAQPAVASVIAGATSPEQVAANVEAGNWEPTPEDLAEIDRIVPPPGG